ncbi:Endoglucanase 11 [Glycine max]|nr:Endoglucanase 11 [Glycine max]
MFHFIIWLYRATQKEEYLTYFLEKAYDFGGTTWAMTEFSWDVKYVGVQAIASMNMSFLLGSERVVKHANEKYLAIVSSRPRVISWEIGEEILKFPNDLGNVEHISISSDAKNLVTLDFKDQHEATEGVLLDDDLNEPTMGEKLASLSVLDGNKSRSDIEQESFVPAKPPSADSVHVLLKQALNADDRTLLLDCLFTQNEKVLFLSYFY